MKKRFYIEAEALKCSINLFFGFKFDEMNKWLDKNGYSKVDDEWGKNSLGLYFIQDDDNKYIYIIWIPDFDITKNGLGVLVHELHHVVERQAQEKGFDCMETKAYLIEYYFKEIMKKYNLN